MDPPYLIDILILAMKRQLTEFHILSPWLPSYAEPFVAYYIFDDVANSFRLPPRLMGKLATRNHKSRRRLVQ
ncbi:MAG: hypothetical protein CFH41_02599 [Alphaproteobacteria bacterium MarineAlpha11_Bin1]|nr:MAG: hypothetical protein CFH41_02599 [Alphaproteobacteria bacterium MarineAlpha11_Bin1]